MSKATKLLQPLTLREWRSDTGHTQSALAKKLNVLAPYISNYENGKQKPSQEVKDKFRKIFPGYDVIEMKPGEDFEQPEETFVDHLLEEHPEVLQSIETIEQDSFEEPVGYVDPMDDHEALIKGSKLYVLQNASSTAVFLTKTSAMEELTKIILEDPEAYGWRIVEAEMK